jgi:hypothetical protein
MIDTEQEAADLAMRLPTLLAFAELGQDKAAVARLYELLLVDIDPGNLIERLWVRDIAVLTIRSEELRLVQLAVHKALMARTDQEFAAQSGMHGAGEGDGAAPAEEVGPRAPGRVLCGKIAQRAVGLTYAEHLAVLNGLAEMESNVRKDRDRIIELIGDRRKGTVHNVLEMILDGLEARRG